MKIAQSIATGYYKTKLRTIALFSPRKAAESAFPLFCTPFSGKPRVKEPAVFHHAEKLSFTIEGKTIRGWRWKAQHSNGKKILIAHGFDSYSYKFEKYIPLFNKEGLEVLAFDAMGHGTSDGKTITALVYRTIILKTDELYGPIYGIMSHSLGGLAASLAAEKMTSLQKLVLIAPATETSRAVDNFFQIIPMGDAVKKEFHRLLTEIGGHPLSYFSVRRAIQDIPVKTLWLHDTDDRICPLADAGNIRELDLPHVRFHITSGLGHSRIYKDDSIAKEIVSFFT